MALHETQHTPGPWSWRGYPRQLRLSSGSRTVMDFARTGFRDAGPRFNRDGLMDPAEELVEFEVGPEGVRGLQAGDQEPGVYRYDVRGVDHPDARLIAAAPRMAEALDLIHSLACYAGEEDTNAYAEALEWIGVTCRFVLAEAGVPTFSHDPMGIVGEAREAGKAGQAT